MSGPVVEQETKRKFIAAMSSALLSILLDILKKKAVKALLVNVIKSSGGFATWLVEFVVENFIKEIGIPIANYIQVEVVYVYDEHTGKAAVKKTQEGRQNGDVQTYNDGTDTIMS